MTHDIVPTARPNIIQRAIDHFPKARSLTALGLTAGLLVGCGSDTEAQPTPTASSTVQQEVEPYFAMPFPAKNSKNLVVTQGTALAPDDAEVIGKDGSHEAAFDVEGIPCGTDILAPYDGVVVAGYQLAKVRGGKPFDPANPNDPETNWRHPVTGQEGPVFSTGLFTEVIAATKNDKNEVTGGVPAPSGEYMTTLIVHMGSVASNVFRTETVEKGTVSNGNQAIPLWHPEGIVKPQGELIRVGTPVQKGDKIGTVGNSAIGLTGDNFDKKTYMDTTKDYDIGLHNTPNDMPWDPINANLQDNNICQTHIQVSGARNAKNVRQDHIDILDNTAVPSGNPGEPGYNNPISPEPGKVIVGPNARLITRPDGRPVYADE